LTPHPVTEPQSSLFKNSITYGLGAILTKTVGFFLIPIYTRYLTVEEYGMLALLNVILLLISFIFLLGVSSASMRFYFDLNADEIYRGKIYGNATILLVIFPLALFIIFTPLIYVLITLFLPSIPFFPYVLVILMIGLFSPIEALMLGLLRVKKRALTFVQYNISLFILQMIVGIVAVAWLKFGLKGLLYAQLFTNMVFWVIAIAILKGDSKIYFSWSMTKKLLFYGIPLIPFFIFTWINTASGRFMLERYSSLRDVGIFALATQFSGILAVFSGAFDNVFTPYFYETAQNSNGSEIIGKFITKYVAIFGLIALCVLVFSQPMILIMAAPKFHNAISYIPSLLFVGFLSLNYKLFYFSLMYSRRTGVISSITGVFALLMVGLLFLFLKKWHMGIEGVIYVLIFIEIGKIIFGYFISQRHFKIKYEVKQLCMVLLIIATSAFLINIVSIENITVTNLFVKLAILVLGVMITLRITKVGSIKKLISLKSLNPSG